MSNKIIHIIGTGPAALMSGSQLALKGYEIHFYDQKVKEIIFLMIQLHTPNHNNMLFIQENIIDVTKLFMYIKMIYKMYMITVLLIL